MDDKFKIKSYGFGELAQMYFPSISKKSAAAQFKKWIRTIKTALLMLENLGYKIGNRLLTPAQVELLINEFGNLNVLRVGDVMGCFSRSKFHFLFLLSCLRSLLFYYF